MGASGGTGVLYEEHVLLGASLAESAVTGGPLVMGYAGEKNLDELLPDAVLSDLTGAAYLLVSGASSQALFSAAAAGRPLAVGEAAFEAVLTGEGRLLSVPLALRSGDHEHVLLDPTPRGAALAAWLGFLSSMERDGYAPYADASVEDASEMLVPLLLAGERSRDVLSDYVRTAGEALPREGEVRALHLDAIPALVAHIPGPGPEEWLLLVPAQRARVIWRSLLSFAEVSPVGARAARHLLADRRPWASSLPAEGPVSVPRAELERWGVLREGSDFVGARLLEP